MKESMILLQNISLSELEKTPLKEISKKQIREFLRCLKFDMEKLPPPKKGFDAAFSAAVLLESLYKVGQETNLDAFKGNPIEKIEKIYDVIGAKGSHAIRLFELLSAIDTIIKFPSKMMYREIVRNGIECRLNDIRHALNKEKNAEAAQSFINLGAFLQEQFPGNHVDDIKREITAFKDDDAKLRLLLREFKKKEVTNLFQFKTLKAIGDTERVEAAGLKIPKPKIDAIVKGLGIFKFCMGESKINMQLIEERDVEIMEKDIMATKNNVIAAKYEVITEHEYLTSMASRAIDTLKKKIQTTLNYLDRIIQIEQQKHPELEARYTSKRELIDNIGRREGHLFEKASRTLQIACKNHLAIKQLGDILNASGTPKKRLRSFQNMFLSKDIISVLSSNPDTGFTFFMQARRRFWDGINNIFFDKTYTSSSKFQAVAGNQLESLKQQGVIPDIRF